VLVGLQERARWPGKLLARPPMTSIVATSAWYHESQQGPTKSTTRVSRCYNESVLWGIQCLWGIRS
jgi:hypothetical protein